MRIAFFVFLLSIASHFTIAGNNNDLNRTLSPQRTAQARPNLPGDLIVDLGVSLFNNAPDTMDLSVLGSRAVNVYYLYHIAFGEESNFSINPGLGLGMENYNFSEPITLQMANGETGVLSIYDGIGSDIDLKKSKLSVNYLEIPVELRFNANRYNHDQGFKLSVGGRIGWLFDAHTKVKYEQNDDMKKLKRKEGYNLNRFRYSVYGKLGIGNFSLFYYANLSNLFKDGEGPAGTADLTTYMTGISFTLF